LKAFLSHELFHVFQRPYYSITIALIQTPHLWWREACAEWASHDLAKIPDRPGWYKDAPYISDRISYNYLKYPLSTIGNQTGTVVGNGLEYQYVTAIFLRFLVREKGFNIKELTERVALDSGADPLRPLRKYVRRQTGKSFDEVYAEFANWLLKTTGLKLFDKIDLKSNAVVAERTVPVLSRTKRPPSASTSSAPKIKIPSGSASISCRETGSTSPRTRHLQPGSMTVFRRRQRLRSPMEITWPWSFRMGLNGPKKAA